LARATRTWIAEETDACFIIRDHTGYARAYVYFEEEPGRRSASAIFKLVEAGDTVMVSSYAVGE
jgi:hypothetical protein